MNNDGLKKLEELTNKLSNPGTSLNDLFDSSEDLICVLNADGYFSKVSASWTKNLGWSEKELLENPFFSFIHEDDIEPTYACWNETKQGKSAVGFKNRYKCKDGSYKTLVWSAPGIRDGLSYSIARIEKAS